MSISYRISGELGAQPPLGFFDPLGLLDDADQDRFDRLRYVEVKHGRIAQLAFLGQVVTRAGIHLGGNIFMDGTQFSDIGDGYAGFASLGSKSIAQIVLFVGILELGVMKDSANGAAPGDFPGDFRNGSLDFGWDTFDEETKLSKRAIELNNGRAAMMGILGRCRDLSFPSPLSSLVVVCLTHPTSSLYLNLLQVLWFMSN